MNTTYTFQSIHELGKRANQEDSLYPDLKQGQSINNPDDFFILCDGMGGHDCGEVASAAVCKAMSESLKGVGDEFSEEDFEKALEAAYDALDEKDTAESEKKMGTTMTFVKFHEGGCFVGHIGDSRVYHIRPSENGDERIRFVTRDHSLVNDLIEIGELTEEEAKHSSQKNVITRAMQPHQERRCKADWTNLTDLRKGDYIYMCSDGMLEVTENNELANILSMRVSDKEKVKILKATTVDNKDNHTAFLIHLTSIDGYSTASSIEDSTVDTPQSTGKARGMSLYKYVGLCAAAALILITTAIILHFVKR